MENKPTSNTFICQRSDKAQEKWKQLCETQRQSQSTPISVDKIRSIIKTDPEFKMINADAVEVMSKFCEIFLQDLVLRVYYAKKHQHDSIYVKDVIDMINQTDMYDFLRSYPDIEKHTPNKSVMDPNLSKLH